MDPRAVAEHYNQRREDGVQGRRKSRIFHLRKFNNWVKSVLIQLHCKPDYSVLDLACGKGGDLQKWSKMGITLYVGCDIAHVSLQQAVRRYNELPNPTFGAMFLSGDCFQANLDEYLPEDAEFDAVSSQFAIHYAFEDEDRVRRLLDNVAVRLKPGGFFFGTTPDANVLVRKLRAVEGNEFGNSVFHLKFDKKSSKHFPLDESPWGIRYRFTLDENVEDCPEFLVHFPSFRKIAEEYDLQLRLHMNFHDFYTKFMDVDEYAQLFEKMVLVGDDGMTYDEWDAIFLYTVFAFQKKGGEPYLGLPRKEVKPLEEREVLDEESILAIH